MRLRRTRVIVRRTSVGVLLGLVFTILAVAGGWLLAGDWVAGRLASYANTKFFTDRSTRLTVGRVTGSVWSDMVFERVRIERQVDGNWISGLWADRVEARYDLMGLIRGRPDFSEVRVFSPVIELAADSTGRIILPIGTAPGGRGGEGLKSLSMKDIVVHDGVFRFSGRLRGFEASHLFAHASLDIKGGGVDLKLQQASMELLDPIGRIEQASGRVLITGRTIQGEDLSMLWEGSSVAGSFHWNPADSLAGLAVDGTFNRLDLGRLRRVAEMDIIPTSGVASGRVLIKGIPGLFTYEADVSGMWELHPVDTLSVAGTRNGPVIHVDRLRLLTPEYDIAQIKGSLDLADGGHLDIAADFNAVQLDSVPFDAVRWIKGRAGGHADIVSRGFLKSEFTASGDIGLSLTRTRAFDMDLSGVTGRVRFVEGADSHLDGLELLLARGGSIRLDGIIHSNSTLDLAIEGQTADWSQVKPVVAVPGLAGAGTATGRVTGTTERPILDMTGRFTGVHGWGLAADSLVLHRLVGPVLPKPELAGVADTRGLIALGRKLDRVSVNFNWKEPRLTLNALDAVNGDTTAAATGWVEFDAAHDAMTVNLAGGHLAMGRFDWVPDRDLVIRGADGRYALAPARWTSEAGGALVSGTFDTGAGTMDVLSDEMDIDLLVLSGPDAAPEFGGGRLIGRLRLRGPNGNPDPGGSVGLTDFVWGSGHVDSMRVDFDAVGGRVTIHHGVARIDSGEVTAAGVVDLPGSAWNVFNDWLDKKDVAWERVDMHDLEVAGHDVDLVTWQAFKPPPETMRGTALGRAVLNGTLSLPTLTGSVTLTDFSQGRWHLDSLSVTGEVRPGQVRITDLVLSDKGSAARVTGTAPLELSLYPWKLEQPARPMDLSIDLTGADLSLLPPAQFGLQEASGALDGTIHLTGTPKEPSIDGELRVSGATVRPKDREEVLEDLSARIVFEGNTARILELSARQGTDGTLTGSGTLPLSTHGAGASTMQLSVQNVFVLQSGEYGVKFDGDLTIDLIPNGNGGLRPVTRGIIHVDRAEIIRELNQTTAPNEPGQDFDYELTIDAPARIFVVNSTVDMELSGDLVARQGEGRFELIGSMQIIRGYYTMLLRRFRIVDGTLTFSRVDVIDPNIDITAETNDAEYIITVRITGQASNPRLSFSARRPNDVDPSPLSEQQILNRLAPGSAIAQGLISQDSGAYDQAGIDVLAGSVQQLFSQVQAGLARSLGIDELRYDTPEASLPGDDRSYGRLTASKSVTSDVTVAVSQELGAAGNELSVEYRLGRLLFLRGEVVRRRATELREEYGIDLRLWHEY